MEELGRVTEADAGVRGKSNRDIWEEVQHLKRALHLLIILACQSSARVQQSYFRDNTSEKRRREVIVLRGTGAKDFEDWMYSVAGNALGSIECVTWTAWIL